MSIPGTFSRPLLSKCLNGEMTRNDADQEEIMKTFGLMVLLLGMAVCCWGGSVGDAVKVQIRSESGRMLPLYPVDAGHPNRRAYAEAVKGDNYTIVVQNRLGRRVGVVVAVDGRNIISGQKSWLASDERMYILEPYGRGEFSGWRADLERVNRFYFTDVPDSYAAAFKDESAMGVIAVAVFPEVRRFEPQVRHSHDASVAVAPTPAGAEHSKKARSGIARDGVVLHEKSESAGTGYGRDEYAPTRIVSFDAEQSALERIYIKYEWRSTLSRLGIIPRDKPHRQPPNRLWDNDGFAPPPPGRS